MEYAEVIGIMSSEKFRKSLRHSGIPGDPEAELNAAMIYDEGLTDQHGNVIIRQNPKRAVFWYRKAAGHGSADAQNNLGYCLKVGRYLRKNRSEAMYWYKKAVKNGSPCAASNIATLYRDIGNNRRAFFWYKRAAEMDDGDALLDIGRAYYYGTGVRRNYQLAVGYYRKAADSENITEATWEDTMYYLGIAYYEGKGVEKSSATAKKYFEQAYSDGTHEKAKKMIEKIAEEALKT